jgi:GxxExxY protein
MTCTGREVETLESDAIRNWPQMNTDEHGCSLSGGWSINRLTRATIGAALEVSNALGCGFLEKIYENALAIELRCRGLKVVQQAGMEVRYRGALVGEYYADLLVQDQLIVEIKAARELDPRHEAQCINYLRAARLPLCLLLNFSRPRLEIRRIAGHGLAAARFGLATDEHGYFLSSGNEINGSSCRHCVNGHEAPRWF